jgi:ribulose-phosphate 3-epimerase
MSRRQTLDRLRQASPVVLPSLLLCDFANLEREVRNLEQAGAKALHLDVMDGNFVPNLTYGMTIVEAVRRVTSLPIDVHLMIAQPHKYLRQFAEAGSDTMTVHVEAVEDPAATLREIHSLDVVAGIALNPATPLSRIEGCLDEADLILVMSVPAGFGGQPFHEVAIDKLSELRKRVRPEVLLEVDGGVADATIARCAQAGAELFVVGSGIFRHPGSYSAAIRELEALASTKT